MPFGAGNNLAGHDHYPGQKMQKKAILFMEPKSIQLVILVL
jgi:hypothetical protein